MKNTLVVSALVPIILAFTGCRTSVSLNAHNETLAPLSATLWVKDKGQPAAELKYQAEVQPNGSLGPTVVGKYTKGSQITLKMSLPTGGVVGRTVQELPAKPNPFPVELSVRKIAAAGADLADEKSVERQITDTTDSFISPTADVGALLEQYLGGIFAKTEAGFQRRLDPTIVGSKVSLAQFMPNINKAPSYSLKLTTDQGNFTTVKALVPQTVDLKADFARSLLYRYEFTLNDTAWRATPHSWYSIEKKLNQTPEGKSKLSDIKSLLVKEGELYYLSSAFVMGDVLMEVASAESIGADVDVGVQDVVHAGGAFKWNKSNADSKRYKNLVLRVRFEKLSPLIEEPTPGGPSVLHPGVASTNGVPVNMTLPLLKSFDLTPDSLRVLATPLLPSTSGTGRVMRVLPVE